MASLPFIYPTDFSVEAKFEAIELTDHLSCFTVEGPDAERYLHGRVTQDIKSLSLGECKKSLVLTPQGKIVGLFSILKRSKDSFFILFHGQADDSFIEELLKFKVADRLSCNKVVPRSVTFSSSDLKAEAAALKVPFTLGAASYLLLIELENGESSSAPSADSIAPVELFHLLRIQNTVPWFGADVTTKTSATEIPYEEYISFTKGCYAGQELVEMSIARGRPNYRLVKLSGKFSIAPTSGDKLIDTETDKDCGFITRGIFNPNDNSFLTLGFLKTSLETKGNLLLNNIAVTLCD